MSDPKKITSLKIFREEVLAGTLTRTQNGCEFAFDPIFLVNEKYTGLSFSMPKSATPYLIRGVNLHPFFAGLLPEGMRLKSLLSHLKTSEDDLFTLFSAISHHTVGDIYAIGETVAVSQHDAPKLREIDFYKYFEELLSINSYRFGDEALAGVQKKISSSMISFPLNIAKEEKSYILKLNPKDKPNLVENEFFSMKLARLCGIKTATVKIVRDKSRNPGLLVERFDRVKTSQRIVKLHQEDFCQVMDRYPSDKYRFSLNEAIMGIKKYVSAEKPSVLKIIKTFCFSYLLGNGDLHAKNMSLLTYENGLTDFSPAYDLLTTSIYGDQHMALKIDGRDDNIKRSHVIAFAKRHGLNSLVIVRVLNDLVLDFSKHYQILKQIPLTNKKWVALEKLINKRLSDLS